ncbi:MAG: beta-propeller fold lactonase family protein, partial [Actinobacteria bacterium]|nr:beta-propeller fold lactonase family protein [Actinomycetota bacterium]
AVYALTNSSAGNAVLTFERGADGSLGPAVSTPSGGLGSGAGLGSQGAVIVADHGDTLFALNAGSDSVSSFDITKHGLRLVDTELSGGDLPISLTYDHGTLYVLNGGTPNSISGLSVDKRGGLTPLPGSTRSLSTASTNPAQVEFTPDGRVLVVSEKGTNRLTSYVVDKSGLVGPPTAYASSGVTPFGFAFTSKGDLIVSNAASTGASSYSVGRDGVIAPITPLAATGQPAACWTVVSRNGRYAYTANTGAGSVSSYAIGHDGSISLLAGVAATTGGSPADAAISGDGRFLYVRNGAHGAINALRIGADGGLSPLASTTGLPAGSVGLAAG